MKTIEMMIIDPAGIHARPASLLVKEANKYNSDIQIEVADKKMTLKSILSIMALGIQQNTEIKIHIDGEDESEAEKSITEFLISEKLAK